MTVPGWDPEKWHAQHSQKHTPASTSTPTRNISPKRVAVAAAVLLLAGAAAVSATHVADDGGGPVGVCHATASDQNPYVFIVVDKDGYEHGHHRHHDGDFFVDASEGDCDGDPPVNETLDDGNGTAEGGNETESADGGNETSEDGDETAADNGTEEPAGNETSEGNETGAPADDGNETAADNGTEEPAGNETEPADGGNETSEGGNETGAPADDGNETAGGNETETVQEPAAAPGNVRVMQTSFQDQVEVTLSISVDNAGKGLSQDVSLTDTLPEMYRTWHLGGTDSDACVLDGRDLSCWFGELQPGESVSVEVKAFTDRMPCGHSLNNTAYVDALDDGETRDNASSAGIEARPC